MILVETEGGLQEASCCCIAYLYITKIINAVPVLETN